MTSEAGPGGGAQAVLSAPPPSIWAGKLTWERLATEIRGTLGGRLVIQVFLILASPRLCDVSVSFNHRVVVGNYCVLLKLSSIFTIYHLDLKKKSRGSNI